MKPSFVFVSMLVLVPVMMLMGCGDELAPDTTAPAAPSLLGANSTDKVATVWWESNTEPDLSGYIVYVTENGVTRQFNTRPITGNYASVSLEDGSQAQLYVTAVDFTGNESSPSSPRTVSSEEDLTGRIILDTPKVK